MYIERVPNRKSRPTILLREARREGTRIRKRTVANLSHWPEEKINSLRLLLRGEPMVPAGKSVVVERSFPYGHIIAILQAIHRTGLDAVIAPKPSKNRSLVIALVIEALICRNLPSHSHLTLHAVTLSGELKIEGATGEDFSRCLDWLASGRPRIRERLESLRAHGQAPDAGRVMPADRPPAQSSSGHDGHGGGAPGVSPSGQPDIQGDFREISFDGEGRGRHTAPVSSGGSRRTGTGSGGIQAAPGEAVRLAGDKAAALAGPPGPHAPFLLQGGSARGVQAGPSTRPDPPAGSLHGTPHALVDELASYVSMRMRQALSPLISPEGSSDSRDRGPHPRHASPGAAETAARTLPRGFDPLPFPDLLVLLSTQCRNRCRIPSIQGSPPFTVLTEPTELQAYACRMLNERL